MNINALVDPVEVEVSEATDTVNDTSPSAISEIVRSIMAFRNGNDLELMAYRLKLKADVGATSSSMGEGENPRGLAEGLDNQVA